MRIVKKLSVPADPKSIKSEDTVRLDGGGGWVMVTEIKAVPPLVVTVIVAG